MNTLHSLRIPINAITTTTTAAATTPKAKGIIYARRIPSGRYVTVITVDPQTNRDLKEVQAIPEFQIRGKELSRATLIRRAIRIYTNQVVKAKMSRNAATIAREAAELRLLARIPKDKKPLKVEDNDLPITDLPITKQTTQEPLRGHTSHAAPYPLTHARTPYDTH